MHNNIRLENVTNNICVFIGIFKLDRFKITNSLKPLERIIVKLKIEIMIKRSPVVFLSKLLSNPKYITVNKSWLTIPNNIYFRPFLFRDSRETFALVNLRCLTNSIANIIVEGTIESNIIETTSDIKFSIWNKFSLPVPL